MASGVKKEKMSMAFEKSMKNLFKAGQKQADERFRELAADLFFDIIQDTPVGIGLTKGQLKGGWAVTVSGASSKMKPTQPLTKAQIIQKLKRATMKTGAYLTNNQPYANVVEYGGYPVPVKFGTWNEEKGEYEIRSQGGFSKQAPAGMVRRNVSLAFAKLRVL